MTKELNLRLVDARDALEVAIAEPGSVVCIPKSAARLLLARLDGDLRQKGTPLPTRILRERDALVASLRKEHKQRVARGERPAKVRAAHIALIKKTFADRYYTDSTVRRWLEGNHK